MTSDLKERGHPDRCQYVYRNIRKGEVCGAICFPLKYVCEIHADDFGRYGELCEFAYKNSDHKGPGFCGFAKTAPGESHNGMYYCNRPCESDECGYHWKGNNYCRATIEIDGKLSICNLTTATNDYDKNFCFHHRSHKMPEADFLGPHFSLPPATFPIFSSQNERGKCVREVYFCGKYSNNVFSGKCGASTSRTNDYEKSKTYDCCLRHSLDHVWITDPWGKRELLLMLSAWKGKGYCNCIISRSGHDRTICNIKVYEGYQDCFLHFSEESKQRISEYNGDEKQTAPSGFNPPYSSYSVQDLLDAKHMTPTPLSLTETKTVSALEKLQEEFEITQKPSRRFLLQKFVIGTQRIQVFGSWVTMAMKSNLLRNILEGNEDVGLKELEEKDIPAAGYPLMAHTTFSLSDEFKFLWLWMNGQVKTVDERVVVGDEDDHEYGDGMFYSPNIPEGLDMYILLNLMDYFEVKDEVLWEHLSGKIENYVNDMSLCGEVEIKIKSDDVKKIKAMRDKIMSLTSVEHTVKVAGYPPPPRFGDPNPYKGPIDFENVVEKVVRKSFLQHLVDNLEKILKNNTWNKLDDLILEDEEMRKVDKGYIDTIQPCYDEDEVMVMHRVKQDGSVVLRFI